MKRILDMLGLSAGSWLGWKLGAVLSLYAGFLVGVVGMGVGLYAVRRLTKDIP